MAVACQAVAKFVAQIFNLPYRRFAIGCAIKDLDARARLGDQQNAILRYSAIQQIENLRYVTFIAASGKVRTRCVSSNAHRRQNQSGMKPKTPNEQSIKRHQKGMTRIAPKI